MRAEPSILPLRLEGVCYDIIGRPLLNNIDVELAGTARTIVLGPNGAGKSLFLRLCHGLLSPTRGTVTWLGPGARSLHDPQGAPASRAQKRHTQKRHAMVFQRPVMLRRSVLANIEHALSVAGGRIFGGSRANALTVLERFGLIGLAGQPARKLSGGEQQRLALARAWALRPEVLFLDEPTANLDVGAVRAVEEMLLNFTKDGIKVVMTTHDLGQARRLAEEVLFLHHGQLIESAPAPQFFAGPSSPEAAGFLNGELLS